jgi:hypothetical protein
MASYATLKDAFGIESFNNVVTDEMNGNFNSHPVITSAKPLERVVLPPPPPQYVEPESSDEEEEPPRPILRRRTTSKRHDVEPFGMPAFMAQLPPAQQDILTAGLVGGGIYVLLSLLD